MKDRAVISIVLDLKSGQISYESNVPNQIIALGMLEKTKELVLRPPKPPMVEPVRIMPG